MNLWLTISARTLVVSTTLLLPMTGAARQAERQAAISPSALVSCGRACGRSREWFASSCSAQCLAHVPGSGTHEFSTLTPAFDEKPEFEPEVPLGWFVSRDAIPSRRALHALGDRPTTALERRVERCRLTL
jgi:hypothetical protein